MGTSGIPASPCGDAGALIRGRVDLGRIEGPDGAISAARTWQTTSHLRGAGLRAAEGRPYGATSATPTATSDRTAGPMATSSP